MRLSTLAIGAAFVATVFFGLPQAFVLMNEALDWPRLAPMRAAGWGLVGAGVLIHLAASARFRRAGGTPVPVEPPDRLVRSGPFRWSRNPIYVADLIVVVGIFALRGHVALLLYVGLLWGALHLWLLRHEEPVLRARFGAEWEAYAARVPRWLGVSTLRARGALRAAGGGG